MSTAMSARQRRPAQACALTPEALRYLGASRPVKPGAGAPAPAHFGSPAAIMCAAAEELSQVPGIGKKSAQRIWQAVNARYRPELSA